MTAETVAPTVRALARGDLEAVVRIDARHTGLVKPDYWAGVFAEFLAGTRGTGRIGLAAERDGAVVGFLFGEVRAFEFGSEACGWVFAVGVEPDAARARIGSALLAEAARRFRDAGVSRVRTMVRRDDVPVMAFFRSNGFVGGSFVQLELDLDLGEDR